MNVKYNIDTLKDDEIETLKLKYEKILNKILEQEMNEAKISNKILAEERLGDGTKI